MNPCERVESLLSAYLEQDASPAESRFVDGHLTACPRCRTQVDEVSRLISRLGRLPKIVPSPGFTDAVLTRTRGLDTAGLEEPVLLELPSSRPVWAAPLAAAAALAVIFVGVVQISERNATVPSMTAQTDPAPSFNPGTGATGFDPIQGAVPPSVNTLDQIYPGLDEILDTQSLSLGMAQDAYVIDNYVLREPAGGGSPILTRVGQDPETPVLVTF